MAGLRFRFTDEETESLRGETISHGQEGRSQDLNPAGLTPVWRKLLALPVAELIPDS